MAKKKKFLRGNTHQYSKLGVRRKNKQKYRKGKGRDNKMRLSIRGHLRKVRIGFKNMKKTSGLVRELNPIIIKNLNDLKKLRKEDIGIVAKIGNKKRKEIAEYAIKNNIKLYLDPKTTLERIEEKLKEIKEKQIQRKIKKIELNKKALKEAEKKAKKEAKEEARIEKKEDKEEAEAEKIEEKEEARVDKREEKEDKITPSEKIMKTNKNQKEVQTNNYGRGK
jgi:ribosomal protein L32E